MNRTYVASKTLGGSEDRREGGTPRLPTPPYAINSFTTLPPWSVSLMLSPL